MFPQGQANHQRRDRKLVRTSNRPPNTRMQSDRFAREIVAFLMLSDAARSRRLMGNPLGRNRERLYQIYGHFGIAPLRSGVVVAACIWQMAPVQCTQTNAYR